jgi:hypothetical protein
VAKIRDNICEYPYEFDQYNSRQRYMLTTADVQANEGMEALPRISTAQGPRPRGFSGQNNRASMRGVSAGGVRQQQIPIIRQAENLDENRLVLYKKSKNLGQGYYIVEISSNKTHLFIAAFDIESPESLLIELPQRRAELILQEFNGDYEKMASSLQVMNKKLALLNPVSSQALKIQKFVDQRRLQSAGAPRQDVGEFAEKDEISNIKIDAGESE